MLREERRWAEEFLLFVLTGTPVATGQPAPAAVLPQGPQAQRGRDAES